MYVYVCIYREWGGGERERYIHNQIITRPHVRTADSSVFLILFSDSILTTHPPRHIPEEVVRLDLHITNRHVTKERSRCIIQ